MAAEGTGTVNGQPGYGCVAYGFNNPDDRVWVAVARVGQPGQKVWRRHRAALPAQPHRAPECRVDSYPYTDKDRT